MVSRPVTDLPTHGLCGWEGRGVSTSHSLAIWAKLTFVIKITEDALRYIGRGAHFSRAGLGGSAYTTMAHFYRSRAVAGCAWEGEWLVRRTSKAMPVGINHQFKTISHSQLGKDGGEVVSYRRLADTQALGDLPIP